MDNKYTTLFKELALATAVSAEQVMDYDKAQNDEKGYETAKTMRDDYQALADSIKNDYNMNKADSARLLVAAMIQTNQLQVRMNNLKQAMAGYQSDIIPKLQEIIDKAETDEDAIKLANEKFIIQEN